MLQEKEDEKKTGMGKVFNIFFFWLWFFSINVSNNVFVFKNIIFIHRFTFCEFGSFQTLFFTTPQLKNKKKSNINGYLIEKNRHFKCES